MELDMIFIFFKPRHKKDPDSDYDLSWLGLVVDSI